MRMTVLYQSLSETMILVKPNIIQRLFGKKPYIDLLKRKIISAVNFPDLASALINQREEPTQYYVIAWQSLYTQKMYNSSYIEHKYRELINSPI